MLLVLQNHFILTQHCSQSIPVGDGSVNWASIPPDLHANNSFVSTHINLLFVRSKIGHFRPCRLEGALRTIHCVPSFYNGTKPYLPRRFKYCDHIRYSTSISTQDRLHRWTMSKATQLRPHSTTRSAWHRALTFPGKPWKRSRNSWIPWESRNGEAST